jgi:hypothetical protein
LLKVRLSTNIAWQLFNKIQINIELNFER